MASYMYKVLGTPTGTTKNTLSVWMKKSKVGTEESLIFANGNQGGINPRADDKIQFYNAGGTLRTDRLFRDTSAWYHIVFTTDTTLSTADDRLKVYINGVQETSFTTRTNPSQNATSNLGTATEHIIGANNDPANYYDGLMSHVQMVDGLALAPTEFGSTDATTGEWKIKTSSYGTLGNNGFHITFDNPADIGASTNSNNFTPNANLKPTQDNPSNVFATLNPLDNFYGSATFSNGNNTIVTGYSSSAANTSNLGMVSGKWYCEIKAVNIYNGYAQFGIKGRVSTATNDKGGNGTDGYIYTANGGQKVNNNSYTSYGTVWNNNDIIGIAVDLDNNKLYFSRNGTWQNSGDPTSGATGTGSAFDLIAPTSGAYYFCTSDDDAGAVNTYQANFGNGYFGTTAVSSAGTNASGNGIFEYDVPTGFTALSTKGLNL